MKCRGVKYLPAFTLIELLVVIAIIAMLLAILLPSLNKVKDKARDMICRTNLKTMQLATILYSDDCEGKMPEYDYSRGLWINKITVYMDEVDDARYCPRTKQRKEQDLVYSFGSARNTFVWDWPGMATPEESSYTINGWCYSEYQLNDNRYIRNFNDAVSPYNIPVFTDAIWVDVWPVSTDTIPETFNLDNGGNNNSMQRMVTNRHEANTNVGFLDGSQREVELSALWSLKWHRDFETISEVRRGPNQDGSPIYKVQD